MHEHLAEPSGVRDGADIRRWLRTPGAHGVEPHDHPAAVRAWQRIRWPLFGVMLLLIPAFYLGLIGPAPALFAARCLYLLVGASCVAMLARMCALSRHPWRFLHRNALDAAIALAALLSAFEGAVPWSTPEWVLRLAFMAALVVRIAIVLSAWLVPHRLLLLLGVGAVLLALAGAGFYGLEPRVHSYADGLWLAFESSATVGYGDIAPTTPASRVFAVFVVLLGYGMLSLTFASIAALFIGEEEKQLRRDMHRDIRRLEGEMAAMREDVRVMRDLMMREDERHAGSPRARPPRS